MLIRLLTVVAAISSLGISLGSAAEPEDSQYSPLKGIHPGNVARLKMAWTYRTGEPLTPVAGGGKAPAFEATAIYFGGLLYIGTPYGKVIALDPLTGKERWSFDAEINRQGNYGDFVNRGVTAWVDLQSAPDAACERRIFFASLDARLFALDARTGKLCEQFGDQGRIDLKSGLRRGPAYPGEIEETSPPAVIDDLVIAGSAIADNVRLNAPSPEVRAFDARTGKLRWTWDPLAGSPKAGAGNAWSRITVDQERHLVFVPTGSASPDYFGGLRPGDNLYANSVVALRSQTGEMVWHFQTVHHDLWDYDVASPPALVTVRRGGKAIAAVAVGSKTGHVFLLDRLTGDPLFPVQERAVPQSDVPGEQASATQPFPTLPPPLATQKLSAADAWGPTEADRKWCQERMTGLRAEGIFTPPSLQGTLAAPGNIGGLQWGGIAADSERGLLVAPSNNFLAFVRLVPRDQLASYRKDHPDWETTAQLGTPFAMSRIFFRSPSGLPCNPPPFGMLSAVDTRSGKIRWQVPLGTMPFPGAKPEWGSINLGGPLATAGGLVFIGATFDPAIRAFDTETGRELWKGDLPASARSTPMTFRAANGKQFIVVAAGGHDPAFGKLDNALVAFTLP
jgi:quinoprotein glucose dehydrogenase